MKRIVKAPEVRLAEILNAATALFKTQGYTSTSVNDIVLKAGIAKGTFYYYFQSKDHILDTLAKNLVAQMAKQSHAIAEQPHIGAIEKIALILSTQNQIKDSEFHIVESMHHPENRELHDRINIQIVKVFSPILACVVEEGNKEGVFQVDDPLSTIQFILAGSEYLLGHDIFNWTPEEEIIKVKALMTLIERALGAAPGVLSSGLSQSIELNLQETRQKLP